MDVSEAKRVFEQTKRLYEQHGKPLEAEHWGKYVAIGQDGKTIVDEYLDVLTQRANAEFGEVPTLITKVGERIESKPRLLYPDGTPEQQEQRRQAKELGDSLYEQYGKPLEAEHWGEYLAVHPDGRIVLDKDREAAHSRALEELGKGYFLFQVGPKATIRWTGIRMIGSHMIGSQRNDD